jgi:nucleotide-binding universal stress UspA family protein
MYQAIMVPLDGSPFSEEALPLAIALTRRSGSTLHLVYVDEGFSAGESTSKAAGRDYPGEVARRIAAEAGIMTRAAHLEGKVVDELAGYIERESIELAVIATHGWGGLSRAWLGSTTDLFIRKLNLPLLTIRPPGEGLPTTGEHGPIEHLLVPLDGSELAESILAAAVSLGGPDARYTLIQVIPAPVPNDPVSVSFVLTVDQTTIEAERTRALAYLDGVAKALAERVRRVDSVVVLEPDPVGSILDFADRNEVDLIAVATHGRGGLRRTALGSVADKILRTAGVPVLVSRPHRE